MGKVQKINDDDEKGTAKKNSAEAPEGGDAVETAVESTGADKAFVIDQTIIRAASLAPLQEDAKQAKSAVGEEGTGKNGIPKGETVVDAAVRGSGDRKFLVVVTDAARKYVKVI